jgi:hypothetical protein
MLENKPTKPTKYGGPAKPIPTTTRVELISDKAERVIFLLFAIFMAVYLYLGC